MSKWNMTYEYPLWISVMKYLLLEVYVPPGKLLKYFRIEIRLQRFYTAPEL